MERMEDGGRSGANESFFRADESSFSHKKIIFVFDMLLGDDGCNR